MGKYRKKPVMIEAIQWTGANLKEITAFMNKDLPLDGLGYMTWEHFVDEHGLHIATLEGDMRANEGDYVIKGVNGEFYPCKPDIFEKTYEKIEE